MNTTFNPSRIPVRWLVAGYMSLAACDSDEAPSERERALEDTSGGRDASDVGREISSDLTPDEPASTTERCDGVDNDGDGRVDEGLPELGQWHFDDDLDGHAAIDPGYVGCRRDPRHLATGDDCDDTNAAVYPGAEEVCDLVDNDCDRTIDEDVTISAYADLDLDGFGGRDRSEVCTIPAGSVAVGGDCDDTNNDVYPGAIEVCNELDDDCNRTVDDVVKYADRDQDGWGGEELADRGCAELSQSNRGGDCDDLIAVVNPGEFEACDGRDNNCDGNIDEGVLVERFADQDLDSWGGTSLGLSCSTTSTPSSTRSGDCDDTDPLVFPQLAGLDTDGDGFAAQVTELMCVRRAGIGFPADCDDTNAAVHPEAVEACLDGVDNNCDGISDCTLWGNLLSIEPLHVLEGSEENRRFSSSFGAIGDNDADLLADVYAGTWTPSAFAGWFRASDWTKVGLEAQFADALAIPAAPGQSGVLLDAQGLAGVQAFAATRLVTPFVVGAELTVLHRLVSSTPVTRPDSTFALVTPSRIVRGSDVVVTGAGDPSLPLLVLTSIPSDGDLLIDLGEVDAEPGLELVVLSRATHDIYVFRVGIDGPTVDLRDEVPLFSVEPQCSNRLCTSLLLWDVDGDGQLDLLIGNSGNSVSGPMSGGIHAFTLGELPEGTSEREFAVLALTEKQQIGWNLARLGDVSGDGRPDWGFGLPFSAAGGVGSGGFAIVSGPIASGASLASATTTFTLPCTRCRGGDLLRALGDVDGDTIADLGVTAPDYDSTAENAGALFVFSGATLAEAIREDRRILVTCCSAGSFGVLESSQLHEICLPHVDQ